MGRRLQLLVAASAALAVVLVALSGSGPAGPAGALGDTGGSQHLVLVVLENKNFEDVVGNPNAPYLNGTLIPSGRLFTAYTAALHPSLPNYLVLTGGDTHGCLTDQCARDSITGQNLFHELGAAGLGAPGPAWKAYVEDMPKSCYRSNAAPYAVRHNPPAYYTNLDGRTGDGSCARDDVPYPQLASDLAAGRLPPFALLVGNLYDDMHTDRNASPCALGSALQDEICQGDSWLAAELPAVLSDGGRNDVTVLVVWDEGRSGLGGGGHVPLLELGAGVTAGTTEASPLGHYGLVNAIADWFGVPRLAPPVPAL